MGDFQELADGIAEIVVTKDEFKDFTRKAFQTFATKDDLKSLATKQEMTQYKSEILDSNDKLSKKLDKILTEQTAIGGNVDEYRGEVKNLKKRVERLESHAGI